MEDLLKLLNEKDNEVLSNKALLYTTDWEVIKATELEIELDATIKAARAQARANINQLEIEIADLRQQIESYIEPAL
jgi:uncharacterized protein YceH (UPF0502 family)